MSLIVKHISTIFFFRLMTVNLIRKNFLQNCEMECFSEAMEQECGCVMYYMPRLNQNSKICTRANYECYNPLRISLERRENSKYDCSCYPSCNSISYSGELSTIPFVPPHLNTKSSLSNFSAESRM